MDLRVEFKKGETIFDEEGGLNQEYENPEYQWTIKRINQRLRPGLRYDPRRKLFCVYFNNETTAYLAIHRASGRLVAEYSFETESSLLTVVEATERGLYKEHGRRGVTGVRPPERIEGSRYIEEVETLAPTPNPPTRPLDTEEEVIPINIDSPENDQKEDEMAEEKLELGAPPAFNGDRSRLEAFVAHCKLVIRAQPKKFDSDAKKIAYILSHMKDGIAEQWKTQYIKDTTTGHPRHNQKNDDFIEELETAFKPLDKGRRARDIIDRLSQGQSSVDAYISAFNSLAKNSGYDNRSLIKKFEDGLSKDVRVKVLESRIDCDTLEEQKVGTGLPKIQELAIDAQRILKLLKNDNSQGKRIYPDQVQSQFSDVPRTYSTATTWQSYNYGEPMDVDAVKFQPRYQRMSQAERERHIKEGLCYRCHKTGHLSRECPMGGSSGRGRGGWRGRGRGTMKARMQFSQEEFKELIESMNDEDKGQALMMIQEDFGTGL